MPNEKKRILMKQNLAVAIRIYEHDYYSDKQELPFAFEEGEKSLTYLSEITKRIICTDDTIFSSLNYYNKEALLLAVGRHFLQKMWKDFVDKDDGTGEYRIDHFLLERMRRIYIVLSKEPIVPDGRLILKELEEAGFKKGQEKFIYCFMGKQHINPA